MFEISSLSKIFFANVLIGTWFGVPVRLHSTWILTFGLISIVNPSFALFWFLIFCIVVLHEFGHIFVGRFFGCKTSDVTLYPFGGAARMNMPDNPKQEFFIALAGPMVNASLIPFLEFVSEYNSLMVIIHFANIGLIFFNLLPVFPMDGGRVFRSVLQMISGNKDKSTLVAARVGQFFCVIFVIFGIYNSHIMFVLVGVAMFSAAQSELAYNNFLKLKRDILADIQYCEKCKEQNLCASSSKKMISLLSKRLQEIEEIDGDNA